MERFDVAFQYNFIRPEQPEKASYPMLVTLSGIVTEVRPELPRFLYVSNFQNDVYVKVEK